MSSPLSKPFRMHGGLCVVDLSQPGLAILRDERTRSELAVMSRTAYDRIVEGEPMPPHKPRPMIEPEDGSRTPADIAQDIETHFAKLRELLTGARVPELARHVEAVLRHATPARAVNRIPMGLIGPQPTSPGQMVNIEPSRVQLPCKLEHLVLSDATAGAYDVLDVRQGLVSQTINPDPLPGDVFSLASMGGPDAERVLEAMRFKLEPIAPGERFFIMARLRNGAPLVPFRGVAWMGVLQ